MQIVPPKTYLVKLCSLSNKPQFITARKRSLGQGNIFAPVCHSVHRGGGLVPGGPGGVWSGGVWSRRGAWWRPPGRLLLRSVRILLECILVYIKGRPLLSTILGMFKPGKISFRSFSNINDGLKKFNLERFVNSRPRNAKLNLSDISLLLSDCFSEILHTYETDIRLREVLEKWVLK